VDDDDNGEIPGWFRRSLKLGGIAGGIAGFVLGSVITLFLIWMRGLLMDETPPMSREEWGESAAMFVGAALTGITGGCVGGVAVGGLFRKKCYFEILAKIAGAVGGVLGMSVLFSIQFEGVNIVWWFVSLIIYMFCGLI
jgi:hypothetical protein